MDVMSIRIEKNKQEKVFLAGIDGSKKLLIM